MTASAASRSMLLAAARSCSRAPSAGGSSSRSVLGCQSSNFVSSVSSMRSHRPEHVAVVGATWGHSLTRSSSSNATPSRMEHNYETQVSPKVEKVFEKILDLDMFEIHLVTELVAEKLGMNVDVSAAAGGGGGGLGGGNAGGASAEEAKTEERTAFDLKLVSFDAKAKIKVIKEVRSIAGLGLKEAKELVEGAPKTVMKEIKMDEAEEIKAKLEALGAVVEIV